MTFFGVTRALVVAVFMGMSGPISAATAASGASDRSLSILEDIQRIEARDGLNSVAVLEPLTSLILLYLEDGHENEAAAVIDRAIQVVRINNGLYSLDQAPLLKRLIDTQERRGDYSAAWSLEQDLLELLRRHPNDLRAVPFLREIANQRLVVLDRFRKGERPPQVEIGCFYKESQNSSTGTCAAGSTRTVVHGLLGEAQRHYSDAIAVMLRNELYASDELHALELDLLRVVTRLRPFDADPRQSHLTVVPRYAPADTYEPWRTRSAAITQLAKWAPSASGAALPNDSDAIEEKHAGLKSSYYRGRQILRRVYAYAAANPSAQLEQATAVAQLADWELLYARRGQAMERYERAHAMLQKDGAATAAIEQLFAPMTPVVLPAFEPNPLARDEMREATGHVDVGFEITRNGRARRIAILDRQNATDAQLERLEGLLVSSTFRPRVIGNGFAEAAPVVLRYYLYE